MAYHSNPAISLRAPIQSVAWYLGAVKVYRPGSHRPDQLATKVLHLVAGTVLCRRVCQPGQAALARMCGRSDRTIRRSLSALVAAGYLTLVRRGRKLTNVLRLARWLWDRIAAHARPRPGPGTGCRPVSAGLAEVMQRVGARIRAG